MNIYEWIQQLMNAAKEAGLLVQEDEIYVRNRVLALLQLDDFAPARPAATASIPDILDELTQYASEKGLIEDLLDAHDILASQIMDCFLSKPSEVNRTFWQQYAEAPEAATAYFYELSQNSNYIQTKRIAKNISYKAATEYGELDITINLSKPEKDPKQIAKEKSMKSTGYPKCLLCVENEGYAGRIGHPARTNHRMVRMDVEGEKWLLQYSPYVYYNEHCILLCEEHRDMVIDRNAFSRLLSFVRQFPHYFAGSNADLPIVGGSILTHDHYQGGNYEFAMARAGEEDTFALAAFPNVQGAIVKWPMSVIRLRSEETEALVEAAAHILAAWRGYSDPSADVLAFSGETPHNTITPIARKRNGLYELDLVLRNNRTSEAHPLGIFHPHSDVHHIKKENIGLIEVMGLAVLPGRLTTELKEVEAYILGEPNELAAYHQEWADELRATYSGTATAETIGGIVRDEVGKKFMRVLEDAGVFKRTASGKEAFKRFIATL